MDSGECCYIFTIKLFRLSSPVSDDTDYEVSAEMLIHGDIDDERTLEEEEIMDQEGEIEGELSDLQKVRINAFICRCHSKY